MSATARTVHTDANGKTRILKADGRVCCSGDHRCNACEQAHQSFLSAPPSPPSVFAAILAKHGIKQPTTSPSQLATNAAGVPVPPSLRDAVLARRA
jgi:hypothetical protein